MPAGNFSLTTSAQYEFIDITRQLERIVSSQQSSGLLYVFNPHTTAGLTINEGADPDVQRDILTAFRKMVPDLAYQHAEGNSPAHIMATLTGCSLTVSCEDKHLVLGRWQRIFFCEFDGPRTRTVHWRLLKS